MVKRDIAGLNDFLVRKTVTKIACALGYTPISDFTEEDVFIVSYPRSGNSWLLHLLMGIAYDLNPESTRYWLIRELIPDVHLKRYYKRYCHPMFFKSHHLSVPEYKRVIYLVRDGRDVMTSYYHYYSACRGKKTDFASFVCGESMEFGKWHEHVESWLSNPYNARMIVIRYEDLANNAAGELKRLCDFIGIRKDAALLENVAKQASFTKLRQKELSLGMDSTDWPKNRMFFRRGIVGSHKDEMPQNALEAFLGEAGNTLKKLGYL